MDFPASSLINGAAFAPKSQVVALFYYLLDKGAKLSDLSGHGWVHILEGNNPKLIQLFTEYVKTEPFEKVLKFDCLKLSMLNIRLATSNEMKATFAQIIGKPNFGALKLTEDDLALHHICSVLLSAGYKLDTSADTVQQLFHAVEIGNLYLIPHLLAHDKSAINATHPTTGESLLCTIVKRGYNGLDIAKHLIQQGANIDCVFADTRETILHKGLL